MMLLLFSECSITLLVLLKCKIYENILNLKTIKYVIIIIIMNLFYIILCFFKYFLYAIHIIVIIIMIIIYFNSMDNNFYFTLFCFFNRKI